MAWKTRLVGVAGVMSMATACRGECYVLRSVDASGRFGDTLVAVSGDGTQPGAVSLRISESRFSDHTSRTGEITLNATGIADTVALHRMTLVSDPSRAPVFSSSTSGYFTPDSVTFEKLFVHVATEDVLFEIVAKNGSVAKALLNLEERQGPKEACLPYT